MKWERKFFHLHQAWYWNQVPPTWVGEPPTGRTEQGRWSLEETTGIAGNISGSQNLCEGPESVHHSLQVGQCHSWDVPEPVRGSPFRSVMQFSTSDLGMVPVSGNNSCSRASPWTGQCDSQPGVEINSRPLRLDDESFYLPSYTTTDGAT